MHTRYIRNHPFIYWVGATILGILCLPIATFADYQLEGHLPISEEWSPRIYLSAINNFEDQNVASEDFVINMAAINSNGSFLLEGANLPLEDRLYRLHICKKGDPVSTIIIGGQEENHIHFVMNNQSELTFQTVGNTFLFSHYQIGGVANQLYQKLRSLHFFWKQKNHLTSQISRDYNELQLRNELRFFADTCSNALLGLLAIYQLDPALDYVENDAFYQSLLEKWATTQSNLPYFIAYQKQLAFLDFQHFNIAPQTGRTYLKWLIPIFFFFLFGFFIFKYFFVKKTSSKPLSIQERKVLELLKAGKSNKEISAELNIGVSTVKTHVYKIYNKLGVRSRKEILEDFKA